MPITNHRLLVPDGRGETIIVDRSDAVQRYRWRCPEGHVDWSPTNSHIYCDTCGMAHYHVVDAKEGERIPWERVTLREVKRAPNPA